MRRNRFDIAVRSLLMGTSVVITAVLVSIGIMQLDRAKGLAGAVSEQLSAQTARIEESDVTAYDGERVTGSEVAAFAAKHLGCVENETEAPFKVGIKLGDASLYGATREFAKALKNSSSAYFIRPTLLFECSVKRNGNGVITEVNFERVTERALSQNNKNERIKVSV